MIEKMGECGDTDLDVNEANKQPSPARELDKSINEPKQLATMRNEEQKVDFVINQKETTFRKSLGVPSGVALIAGIIIGSGIFLSPTSILKNTNSIGLAFMVWIFCGFLSFLTGICFIELGLMIPLSGSNYPYLTRGLGPLCGFLFTWTYVFIVRPASSATLTYSFALYVLQPFYSGGEEQIPAWQLKIIAVVLLVLLSILNSVSVDAAARFQIVFTATKLLGLAIIIVTGMIRLGQGHTESFQNSFEGSKYDVGDLGFAIYAGLWAYSGWNELNYSTEEIKDLNKTLPRSIFISMILVTAFYVLVNVSYSAVLSKEEMLKSGAVAVLLGDKMLGKMSWCIPLFVACSTLGATNGGIFSRGRMVFAAAREGHLPRVFGMIQTRFRTPIMGILLNLFFAIMFLIPRGSNFDKLIGYLSFSAWLFHGLTLLALLVLRYREPELPRPFKVWTIVPVIALLACTVLVLATFIKSPIETSAACLFILLGVPIYYSLIVRDLAPSCLKRLMDASTSILQKVLGIAPSQTVGTTKKREFPDELINSIVERKDEVELSQLVEYISGI